MSATVELSELDPVTRERVLDQIGDDAALTVAEQGPDETFAAEQEIRAAWSAYQTVERHGLEFGRVCYEWQQKFKVRGFRGDAKGEGIYAILHKCGIPPRTAYFWITRYKESQGIKHDDSAPSKPKSTKPAQELKQLADAIPPIRNGKEITPPSQYSAADIVETVTIFTDNLVNQRHLSISDRKTVYVSVIREFQDILAGMAS